MRHFLAGLDYPDKDTTVACAPDAEIVGPAAKVVNRADHILGKALHPSTRHAKTAKP